MVLEVGADTRSLDPAAQQQGREWMAPAATTIVVASITSPSASRTPAANGAVDFDGGDGGVAADDEVRNRCRAGSR